jgi:hypothetical protein
MEKFTSWYATYSWLTSNILITKDRALREQSRIKLRESDNSYRYILLNIKYVWLFS